MILASASPWRLKLLKEAGFKVVQRPLDINESLIEVQGARATALARARAKGALGALRYPTDWLLAADTVVEGPNGDIVGKAHSEAEARAILMVLLGSTRWVYSAVVIRKGSQWHECVAEAQITLKNLSSEGLEDYLGTGEWEGKAGALSIQGAGEAFVEKIEGEEAAVIGLPLKWIVNFFQKE